MSGLFGGGSSPAPLPPPPPVPAAPSIDNARRRQEAADSANRRKGRSASLFTGASGIENTPVQTKTLFGS